MDIQNRRELRREARAAVAANTGDPRLTVLIYIAVTALSGLLSSTLSVVLNQRIADTGGLQALGLQAILSTIQTTVPLLLSLALLGLDLGHQGVCLRLARRTAVQPRDLLMGFPRFGTLLWATILQGGLYLLLLFVAFEVGAVIFSMTPLAADLYDIMAELMMDTEAMYTELYTDPALLERIIKAILPAYPIGLGVFLLVAAPFFYRFRMTNFCLLDNPGMGAMASMRQSGRMTKGSRFALFKLDLGFWWFWLGQLACAAIMYGDTILASLGVVLPWSATTGYFIFYICAMTLEGVLYYFALNRFQTTYALAYEALRPQPQQGGVVLGNIFDLAREQGEN